jgi:UDP-N-acetylmuramoyl-tripeptide--D-alanyl-D-alanine ligase
VIAITGSYGKTSTKQILAHVLSTVAPTLATPGSVNTPLGIARIVREQLKPQHRFFIAEMGAYGPGSIARLCDLAPPDLAAITAVGEAHYERFRSLETVAEAKFEIAAAALARGGHVVVNADQVERRFHGPHVAASPDRYTLVTTDATGAEPGADTCVISDAEQTIEGIALTLGHGGETYHLTAPLYGLHHCANVALAFVLARRLGVPAESIVAALRSTPQVQHRLQVIRAEGRPTLIDDAYNSNPVGFTSALALLDCLAGTGGRRVLVTPGMVELGERHEAEHQRIGRLAGDVVDLALVIGPERIPSFLDGFEQGSRPGRTLHRFSSFAEAKRWLDANAARDDVVLIENDLPDLYERRIRL